MKTTLEIPDALFRQVKAKAALDGIKLKDMVAEGLRLMVRGEAQPTSRRRVKLPLIRSRAKGHVLPITGEQIKQWEVEADLERHASSL